MADHPRPRDIHGRRPTSESRGRTHERILAQQHEAGRLPGAEDVLAERPDGSIAAAICEFHVSWVESKLVTVRRGYERSLALFARDLAEHGPAPAAPVTELTPERLVAHLDWRISVNLRDPGELQRSALHLARFAAWLGEHGTPLDAPRDTLRAAAVARIAALPPVFHVATDAAQLRGEAAREHQS